ncbi:MAG: hypothetical protein ACLU21_03895 [Angelakisella sp.]
MPNYKEMYESLMMATEQAIRDLIQAQLLCEEMYLRSTDDEELDEE